MTAPAQHAGVNFVVEHTVPTEQGRARIGSFKTRKGTRENTPAFFLTTRQGCVPHVTPDLLRQIPGVIGLDVNVSELVSRPGVSVLEQYKQQTGNSLHNYINCKDHTILLRVGRESGRPSTMNAGLLVPTVSGRAKVGPDEFAALVNATGPDFAVCMSDELDLHTGIDGPPGNNRKRRSVTRSWEWLNQVIRQLNTNPADVLIPVVQGGISIPCRTHGARQINDLPSPGVGIGGLQCGEAKEVTRELVNAVVTELTTDRPRFAFHQDSPEAVLSLVESGIDFITSIYPTRIAETAHALTFPLLAPEGTAMTGYTGGVSGPYKISLRNKLFVEDQAPLVQGCQCYACTHHHRAYINHLLNCHEMLAEVLLSIHNIYHYSRFFESLRAAIRANTFEKIKNQYLQIFHPGAPVSM